MKVRGLSADEGVADRFNNVLTGLESSKQKENTSAHVEFALLFIGDAVEVAGVKTVQGDVVLDLILGVILT